MARKWGRVTALTVLAAMVLLASGEAAPAAADDDGLDQRIVSRFCIVHYRNLGDLVEFNRAIQYLPEGVGVEGMMAPTTFDSLQQTLARKIDALFLRAQTILDMRRRMKRVHIRIYPDKAALAATYRRLFRAPCDLRAWYLFETRTIYLNLQDVHEGILAHELGHHIIDHFFEVRPPSATAEILARYIDAHLFH